MTKDLITPGTLAERWNVTIATLSQWRWNGRGPQYLKLGRRVMYRIQDIAAFEDQKTYRDTSHATATNRDTSYATATNRDTSYAANADA